MYSKALSMLLILAVYLYTLRLAQGEYACTRGYSAKFEGENPVAVPKKGYLNFSDAGWDSLDTSGTFALWFKYNEVNYKSSRNVFQLLIKDDLNYFQPFYTYMGYVFGRQIFQKDESTRVFDKWHHYAAVLDDESMLRIYIDGEVVAEEQYPIGSSFRGINAYISFGNIQNIDEERIKSHPEKGPWGELDDFVVFSRALNQSEILSIMSCALPLKEEPPSDLVLYYDFEPECDLSYTEAECAQSDFEEIRNYGISGNEYNLLLGKVPNPKDNGNTRNSYIDERRFSEDDSCIEESIFSKPKLIKSTVPILVNISSFNSAPIVLYVQNNETMEVAYPIPEAATCSVLSLPDNASLSSSSAPQILVNDSINSNFYLHSSTVIKSAFKLQCDGKLVVYHIHPVKNPSVLVNILNVKTIEDKSIEIRLGRYGTEEGSSSLRMKILELPSRGKIREVGLASAVSENKTFITEKNIILSKPDGVIEYTPDEDGQGEEYDKFIVCVVSKDSLLSSSPILVSIDIESTNDLPVLTANETVFVEEDSDTGVIIDLFAYDAETVPGVVVSELPKKGKLFHLLQNGSKGRPILAPYNIHETGDVIEQYVSEVLSVSSFWGAPMSLAYHPLNIIGSSSCSTAGECQIDEETWNAKTNIPIGDLVMVDRHLNEPDLSLLTPAKVIEMTGPESSEIYEVEILPMQKLVDSTRLPCTLEGESCTYMPCIMEFPGSYPSNCNISAWEENSGPFIVSNLTRNQLYKLTHAVWSPLHKNFVGNRTRVGGQAAAAFGSRFDYYHNQIDSYNSGTQPKYTEFIEFKIKQQVYATTIEVGSPRGAGAVVSIKAKDSIGQWQIIYSGIALKEQWSKTNVRGLYHIMDEKICKPFFATDTFRLELDTSAETGISDWNYIDYVKVFGSVDAQSATLSLYEPKLLYIPSKNEYGTDSFTLQAYDCGGNRFRSSIPATTNIQIKPDEDELVIEFHPSVKNGKALEANPGENLAIQILVTDYDDGSVQIYLKTQPRSGSLFSLSTSGNNILLVNQDMIELRPGVEPKQSIGDIVYRSATCESLMATTDFFQIDIVKSNGASISRKIDIMYDCYDLPIHYNIYEPEQNLKSAVWAYTIIGCTITIFFVGFNYQKKNLPAMKLTTPIMNIITCFGCFLVYMFILLHGMTNTTATCNLDSFDVNNTIGPDLDCSRNKNNTCCEELRSRHCSSKKWFLLLGVVICFGSLFIKTLRVILLFNFQKLSRTRTYKLPKLLKGVGSLVFMASVYQATWSFILSEKLVFKITEAKLNIPEQTLESYLLPVCISRYEQFYRSTTYTISSIMLAFGLYLAYKLQQVQSTVINDRNQIALSMYNIGTFGATIILFSNFLTFEPGFYYLLLVTLTFLCTILTQFTLFFPRVIDILWHNKTKVSVEYNSSDVEGKPHGLTVIKLKQSTRKLFGSNDSSNPST